MKVACWLSALAVLMGVAACGSSDETSSSTTAAGASGASGAAGSQDLASLENSSDTAASCFTDHGITQIQQGTTKGGAPFVAGGLPDPGKPALEFVFYADVKAANDAAPNLGGNGLQAVTPKGGNVVVVFGTSSVTQDDLDTANACLGSVGEPPLKGG